MFKKMISILLGLLLIFFAGCGNELSGTSFSETSFSETLSSETEPAPEFSITLPDYTFTRENFPRMDGSTASVPMGQAIASALLGETMEEVEDLCKFNRTTQSFRNLLSGLCDILVVGEPNASVYEEMEAADFGYELSEIATDALIFIVNAENPVESLTTGQLRDIYSGKITNWKEVGGNDAEIIPFQRNEGAGSQALMKKLVMKDTEFTEAPADHLIDSMGGLMDVIKTYDNSSNAIGYSVYYYANDMKMATGLKILSVDGVEPNAKTIRSRTYPHLNAYYCVIPTEPDVSTEEARARAEAAKVIFSWLSKEGGQKLVASMGYVSILDVGEGEKQALENYYGLIDGTKASLPELTARNDYGALIPYIGASLHVENAQGFSYILSGTKKGFFDAGGRLVTDPIYQGITTMSYMDNDTYEMISVPMYLMAVIPEGIASEADVPETGNVLYRIASLDGSFVSEKEYASVRQMPGGIMCSEAYDGSRMDFFDYKGHLLFTDEEILAANPDLITSQTSVDWYSLYMSEGFLRLSIDGEYWLLSGSSLAVCGGPFDYVDGFRGETCIMTSGQKYGLIDRNMEPILEPEYDIIVRSAEGTFAAYKESDKTVWIFNSRGKLLGGAANVSGVTTAPYGFRITSSPSSLEQNWKLYSATGEVLYDSSTFSETVFDSIISAPCSVDENGRYVPDYSILEPDGYYLYDYKTDRSAFVEGANYLSCSTGRSYFDEALPYLWAYHMDFTNQGPEITHFRLMNKDLETLMEEDGSIEMIHDYVTGKYYLAVSLTGNASSARTLYDSSLTPVAEDLPEDFSVIDDLIVSVKDTCTEARDMSGNLVFRYVMAGSLED